MIPEMDMHEITRRRRPIIVETGRPAQGRLGSVSNQFSPVNDTTSGNTVKLQGVVYPMRGGPKFGDGGVVRDTIWTLLCDVQQQILTDPVDPFSVVFEDTDLKEGDAIEDPFYPNKHFRVDYVENAGSKDEHFEVVLKIVGPGEQ